MKIRPFRPEDLDVIRQITVEAFDGVSIDQSIEREFGIINGHDWQWRKGRHIDEDVRRDAEGIFVVEIDGRIVGSITTWQDTEAGVGHIPNITFAPEFRGRGLGHKLIRFAFEHFRKCGLTHARIETLVQNDVGNHLYASLGFREVSRQIHFCAELSEVLPEGDSSNPNADDTADNL